MPTPAAMPTAAWELAETKEMEQVIGLYGKTYHFWQVDRGDKVPMGPPELMVSFTGEAQCPGGLSEFVGERDARFQVDSKSKAEKRRYIEEPKLHGGEFYCVERRKRGFRRGY